MPNDDVGFSYSAKLAQLVAATRDRRLERSDLAVYSVLIDAANSATRAWDVSLARIIAESRVPRSTCIAALKRLEAAGWFAADKKHGCKSRYHITSPAHGTSPVDGTSSAHGLRRGSVDGTTTGPVDGTSPVPHTGPVQAFTGSSTGESTGRPGRKSRPAVTWEAWADDKSEEAEKRWQHHISRRGEYLDRINVPRQLGKLFNAWCENKWAGSGKRYRDWERVFMRALEDNWHRLWYFDPQGECCLTTAGIQLQRDMQASAA
jgi:hypothetical protein